MAREYILSHCFYSVAEYFASSEGSLKKFLGSNRRRKFFSARRKISYIYFVIFVRFSYTCMIINVVPMTNLCQSVKALVLARRV